jgi:hypothetical protein
MARRSKQAATAKPSALWNNPRKGEDIPRLFEQDRTQTAKAVR